jgi:PAS domain S-box-containing protein
VAPTESYVHAQEPDRLRQIAVLQQRAVALEADLLERAAVVRALEETIARRRAVEDELQRRERELRDFLENGLEPMHWVGPQGTILWANRAELAMLGYTRDEYVGRHIADFHADRAVIDDILGRLQRGEELRNVTARLRAKDGSIRTVLISSNVFWQDGKFIHTRCFSRDITDLAAIAAALRPGQ